MLLNWNNDLKINHFISSDQLILYFTNVFLLVRLGYVR